MKNGLNATLVLACVLVLGCTKEDSRASVAETNSAAATVPEEEAPAATESAVTPSSTPTDDRTVTLAVQTALAGDRDLKDVQINVETKEGTVTLTGTVTTPEQKEFAEKTAAGVTGVREVVNNLRVRGHVS